MIHYASIKQLFSKSWINIDWRQHRNPAQLAKLRNLLSRNTCTIVRKILFSVIKRLILCFRFLWLFLKEQFNVLPTHLFFSLVIPELQEIFFYSKLETQNLYIRSDKKADTSDIFQVPA